MILLISTIKVMFFLIKYLLIYVYSKIYSAQSETTPIRLIRHPVPNRPYFNFPGNLN